ncbi:MAG TPA: type II secretion system F family protein [Sedimentisphaerales bacterium]|nr:type II secretion system F family protein [Sedimentisphaerales bacterium]
MAVVATKPPDSADLKKQGDKFGPSGLPFDSPNASYENHAKPKKDQFTDSPRRPAQPLYRAKVRQNELILFTTQLSVMLDSGVVLSDALDAIAGQAEHGFLKMIVVDVAETVKSGEPFSKALSAYPRVFNSMFVSMVRASEVSGTMAEMLKVLSGYLNFESETRKRIKGALTYPFIMALMAVAATGTLMFFVLPRFMRIYEAKGAALPKITQVLVAFSRILGNFELMTVLLTVLILASIALYYWAATSAGRRIIDYAKIHTPVLGTMFIDTIVTRSMRIMATMVGTGVNLLDTIEVIQGSCENHYFQQLWIGVDDKIRSGYQLSESILLSPGSELIAPGIIQMLRAGEKSGKLGDVSDKVSLFYEKKLESSIKNVMALIEPLMITILGAIIGTIAIALLLPVFRISSVIAH